MLLSLQNHSLSLAIPFTFYCLLKSRKSSLKISIEHILIFKTSLRSKFVIRIIGASASTSAPALLFVWKHLFHPAVFLPVGHHWSTLLARFTMKRIEKDVNTSQLPSALLPHANLLTWVAWETSLAEGREVGWSQCHGYVHKEQNWCYIC